MANRISDAFSVLINGKPKVEPKKPDSTVGIPPGRVSKPDKSDDGIFMGLRNQTSFIQPTFRKDIIPLIRSLYKVNPDMGIALQDMFKLANTPHEISFPYNTVEESQNMIEYLNQVTDSWSTYTAGISGLINKMITQCLVSGAISIEGVPKKDLSGLSTIVFVKPESILFHRRGNGIYHPYQVTNTLEDPIKLNLETYIYISMFNDTDEPYGIPPFMPSLEPLDGQHVMKLNFKNIMEIVGMLGFLNAKIKKPAKAGNESDQSYQNRLNSQLTTFKERIKEGMAEGIIVGHIDDHEFDLASTSKQIGDIEKPWNMNQQSVANGLGVSSNIIGVSSANTEGGAGIMLSKLISQLRNLQILVAFALQKLYALELRLAGFNSKGIKVTFTASTVSDELKVQQGLEIKVRNAIALYNQGIYSQEDVARAVGKDVPDVDEPRFDPNETDNNIGAKKQKDNSSKAKEQRRTRDRKSITPKRKDQDSRAR